jgi:hypothetical protein
MEHRKLPSKNLTGLLTMKDTWDMTEGFFHNCEKPRTGDAAPKDPFEQGSVAPIVMVTPVRRKTGPATHVEQVRNLHKLCR